MPFTKHVHNAEKAAGGNGFVTIETLRAEFTSPAWEPLQDKNSVLCRILLSAPFKNPEKGTGHDQIDANFLILYGLLLC